MLVALASALGSGCSESDKASTTPGPGPAEPAPDALASGDPVLVGAGDIASCDESGDEKTAGLLDGISGTVFAAGDNVYDSGTAAEYRDCYGPTWGRHKDRTRPVPGNHEYLSPGAAPYFDYFAANVGPAGRSYYSYDLGAWHVVALDSNIAAEPGSAQYEWLREDLAASHASCTLAYWHHPVFSSGYHGNNPKMAEIWRLMDEAGVDVVIAGHDHDYERFAPQTASGQADPNGIRQFVVGTGGRHLRPFVTIQANSEVRNSDTFGVLKLTLHDNGYDWAFLSAGTPGTAEPPAGTVLDSGSDTC